MKKVVDKNILENEILCDENLDSGLFKFLDYNDIIALKYKESFDKRIEIKSVRNVINFVLSGKKIFGKRDELMASENEILFIKSGNFRAVNQIANGAYKSCCIFFSNIFLLNFLRKHKYLLDLIQNHAKVSAYKIKSDIYINEQINSLSVYFDNKDNLNTSIFKEIIKLKTEALFLLLINREDKVFSSYIWSIMSDSPFFKKLLNGSDKEFDSVNEMAEVFGMNISLFSKNFKNTFGISPKEWLDNEKFEKAKLLIEFSNKNVTEVCKELKIHSIAWFIERFRSRYGATPKQLQKTNNLYFGK